MHRDPRFEAVDVGIGDGHATAQSVMHATVAGRAMAVDAVDVVHELRDRLTARAATDGTIDDLGAFHSLWFTGPDGMRGELTLIVDPASKVSTSLLDADAVLGVLGQTDDLAGRTVVDLTSTTPHDATRIHTAVKAAGGRSLIGAVMATPPMVGTGNSLVLYSGDRAAFDEHRSLLAALGGDPAWVDDEPGAAALLDLAMLDLFYGSVTAFVHAAALAGADGRSAREFLPYARATFDLAADTAVELADDLDAGRYPGEDNGLAMMLRGADHIVDASVAEGLDPAVPELTRRLMRAAVDDGHGTEGYGRIVDGIRGRQSRS